MSVGPISQVAAAVLTRQGTFTNSKLGAGTLSEQVTKSGATRTVDRTLTYANGKVADIHNTITRNADGSTTIDSTRTLANGKTVTRDVTLGAAASDGTRTITGKLTTAAGVAETISGLKTKTANGYAVSQTITGPQNATSTVSDVTTNTGAGTTDTFTATDSSGKTISQTNTLNLLV